MFTRMVRGVLDPERERLFSATAAIIGRLAIVPPLPPLLDDTVCKVASLTVVGDELDIAPHYG